MILSCKLTFLPPIFEKGNKIFKQKQLFLILVSTFTVFKLHFSLVKKITIAQFWESAPDYILFDVRTPAEFTQGHIPNAHNLPLFSNEERAVVGTLFKKSNPKKALLQGLDFVGPKMRSLIEQVDAIKGKKKVAIHCWRGGKRSGSVAWLLNMAGLEVVTVEGGYKAYRNYVLNQFKILETELIILGGKTGCGKTKILNALVEKGEQIIDLEGLAHHKGSAFGFIGEAAQPTVEQFENNLFSILSTMDLSKRIWVENESRRIGNVLIPQGFWNKMRASRLVNIELPFEVRLNVSLEHYSTKEKEALIKAFNNIKKRLGGQNLDKALSFLEQDNLKEAARIALNYYDKSYQYMLEKNDAPIIDYLKFEEDTPIDTAEFLIKFINQKQVFATNI